MLVADSGTAHVMLLLHTCICKNCGIMEASTENAMEKSKWPDGILLDQSSYKKPWHGYVGF